MKLVFRQRDIEDSQLEAKALLKPGMTLYGYCGGVFGRDSYGDKTILLIKDNTIVVKEQQGSKWLRSESYEIYDWKELIIESNSALESEDD